MDSFSRRRSKDEQEMINVRKVLLLLIAILIVTSSLMSAVYDIQAVFNPQKMSIEGSVRVTLDEVEPVFLLWPNLSRSDNPFLHSLFDTHRTAIDILGVHDAEGNELHYRITDHPSELLGNIETRRDAVMTVDTQSNEIIIDFITSFSKSFDVEESSAGDFFAWRFCWYPVHTSYLDGLALTAHEWTLSIDLPEKWKAVVGGSVQGDDRWSSEGKSFSSPLVLLREDRFNTFSTSGRSSDIEIHHRKGQEKVAAAMAAHTTNVLNFFSSILGPLSHETVRIVQNPYPGIYGLAGDGLLIIGDGLFTTSDLWVPGLLDPLSFYLVAHEIAHLWFGIGVGVDFLRDDFLSEGIAEYLAHIALLELYGEDMFLNWRAPDIMVAFIESLGVPGTFREADQYNILDLSHAGVAAAVDSTSEEIPANFKQHIHYTKAKRAFLMLEDLISRETLVGVLKDLHSERQKSRISGEDLYRLLHEYADEHVIDDLFRNPEEFDASVYTDAGSIVVDLGGRTVPVRVTVEDTDSTTSYVVTETTVLPRDGVRRVTVDPDWHSFDFNRHNNHWPRLFRIAGDDEVSKFDAYTLGLEAGVGFGEGMAYADGLVYVAQFPYWNLGLTSRQYFFSEEGSFVNSYGIMARYAPTSYLDVALRLDSVSGLEVDLSLWFPESLDIGLSSQLYAPRKGLYILGVLRDLDSYLVLGGIRFDNLLRRGMYLAAEYGYLRDNDLRAHLVGAMGAYFPDTDWSFTPHISGIHLMEIYSSGTQSITDSYLRAIYPLTINSSNENWRTSYLTDVSVGFSYMSYLSRRFNLFNLISFGGMGISIEANYIGASNMSAIGAVITLVPRFYIVTDAPISAGVMIGVYSLLGEKRMALSLDFGMSFGSSIFFGVR